MGLFLIAGIWGLAAAKLAAWCLHRRMRAYENENRLLRQQNEYYSVSYRELERQWLNLRRMRHDMKNIVVLEMAYLEKGEYKLLMEHYREEMEKTFCPEKTIYTGNMGIDSIVNYKLQTAERLRITVEQKLEIHRDVPVRDRDLNILIGNLMDNAIEAVGGLEECKRRIRLSVRADRTALFLGIGNPFEGKRKRDRRGTFLTDKEDKHRHGLGLTEVKDIVKKYNGQIDVEAAGGWFQVRALLYIGDKE